MTHGSFIDYESQKTVLSTMSVFPSIGWTYPGAPSRRSLGPESLSGCSLQHGWTCTNVGCVLLRRAHRECSRGLTRLPADGAPAIFLSFLSWAADGAHHVHDFSRAAFIIKTKNRQVVCESCGDCQGPGCKFCNVQARLAAGSVGDLRISAWERPHLPARGPLQPTGAQQRISLCGLFEKQAFRPGLGVKIRAEQESPLVDVQASNSCHEPVVKLRPGSLL